MERALIYARVSTDDQRGNYSIPTQIDECIKYATQRRYSVVGDRFVEARTGRDVVESEAAIRAFVDDFTSRELSRPGLDAALEFASKNGCDVLIVYAIDRLARDPYIRQTLEREFRKLGVRIEYVSGNYEESAEGEVRKDLDSTFAKWENAKRVERSLRGKRAKAESGLFVCGRAPFGYRVDKNVTGGLQPEPSEVEVVQRIFHLFVNDLLSLGQIVKYLNNTETVNFSGKTSWARSSVSRMLRNPVYVGHLFYNKHLRKERRLVKREKREWIQIQTQPIISEGTFKAAQEILKDNHKHLRRKTNRFYLLSGMVFCSECNHAYSAQAALRGKNRRKNDARSYRHRIKQGHCLNRTMPARKLEQKIWHEITDLLLDPENLRKGYSESLANYEAKQARQNTFLGTLHEALSKLEQKRQLLNQAYIDPDIQMPKSEYMKAKRSIEDQATEVNEKIAAAEEQLSKIPTPAALQSFEQFTSEIRNTLVEGSEPTDEEKRALLKMLHIKVNVPKEGVVQITGWFKTNENASDAKENSSDVLSTSC